jgi:type IV fimbrial biogenesis protein FimT
MQFAGQNRAMNTFLVPSKFQRSSMSGFSLIETMIVVILVSIAATVAIPSFRDSITRNTISTSVNEFQMALSQARSEAIRSRFNTVLQSTPNDNWTEGWTVYTDKNYNNVFDGDDALLYTHAAAPSGLAIADNDPNTPGIFVFQSSGFPSFSGAGGVMRKITFTMNGQSTSLCVSFAGRARVMQGNGACV